MNKRYLILILILIFTNGCAAFHQPVAPNKINGEYYNQIKEWQGRIKQEGWSKNTVDKIMDQCIVLVKYKTEKTDYWDTPKEFMQNGFQGDCEDIAIFMMATLKKLDYPHKVRVVAVSTWLRDHAILKVQMPKGNWKNYETIPMPFQGIDRLFYKPIVEFDENEIIYYSKS